MVVSGIIFSIIVISLMVGLPYVQAFNIHGPTPIPGYLIPHPSTSHHTPLSKHVGGTLHLHTFLTIDLK